jgi:DNA-binding Lrp family transcriptional regulator
MERQAQKLLRGWLSAKAKITAHGMAHDGGADLVVRDGPATLVIEVKRLGEPGWLGGAIEQAQVAARKVGRNAVPVVAVPFMAEGGRSLCQEAKVSWFDLSGNAHIEAPGLRIHVEGKPNVFKRRGRPSTVFAPKSSRIVRALLLDPQVGFSQRELARRTGLDEGFTSRVVRKLEADGMVERGSDGTVRIVNPDAVLAAWRETYDFSKHRTVAGHVTARSGDELVVAVGAALRRKKFDHAATGLAGAWLLTKFANFRLATILVPEEPPEALLRAIGFRREERGANLWFTIPNDEGVFTGAADQDGVRCVHPIQTYLDLKSHPERSAEAAEELRTRCLRWRP